MAETPSVTELRQRVTVLEVGHQTLTNQMADLTIQQADMAENLEKAIERAFDSAISKLLEKAQQQAAERTGRWLWGSLKALASRWLLIAAIVVTVGKFAGWQMASAVFDAITGKGK